MFKQALPFLFAACLAWPGWSVPLILSDNLATPVGGSIAVTLTTWQAQQFSTDFRSGILQQVVLNVSQSLPGDTVLDIYASVANEPGASPLGSLVSTGGYGSSLSPITYTGSLALTANTAYFAVLRATSGQFAWGYADNNIQFGVGASRRWASSTDSGANWSGATTEPYQMRATLEVAAVPELQGMGAPLALSLMAGMLLTASSRRRAV
jgi:hypothetical protein